MVYPAQLAEGGGALLPPVELNRPLQPSPQQDYVAICTLPHCPMPFPLLPQLLRFLAGRETREGWPLLTIETEANGDSKRTNEKGSFLGWFVELVVPVQEIFCFALAALIGPVQNIFVLNVHRTSIPLSPSASKLGRQPCWVACLLVCVSVVGNAKNSAAEKDFFYQPISLLRPNFSPSYYTRTAPDDDNFCLFL